MSVDSGGLLGLCVGVGVWGLGELRGQVHVILSATCGLSTLGTGFCVARCLYNEGKLGREEVSSGRQLASAQ